MKIYYVYILSSRSKNLYVGITGDLLRRVNQHKQKSIPSFTKRYNITMLVYYETTHEVRAAIEREKQIKGWKRQKKIDLIKAANPAWEDLSREWYGNM